MTQQFTECWSQASPKSKSNCCTSLPPLLDQVWSRDFVCARTHAGRPLQMLTLIDEFIREYPAIDVEWRLTIEQVLERLSDLFVNRGMPKWI